MATISQNSPEFLASVTTALIQEQNSTQIYEELLKTASLDINLKTVFEEILEDEKDHCVLLASLLSDEISDYYPNSSAMTLQTITEAVDKYKLSVSIQNIGIDSLSNRTIYKVEADCDLSGTSLSKISEGISSVNLECKDENITITYVKRTDDLLVVLVKIEDSLSILKAKELITQVVEKCK